MPLLNPYERRMKKLAEERAKLPPPPPPDYKVIFIKSDPQYVNRVERIKFGPQALKDFPRLASKWAKETER